MKVRKILKHDLRFLQGTKAMSFGQGSGSLNTRQWFSGHLTTHSAAKRGRGRFEGEGHWEMWWD